nr:hypothetical protein [uncultured Desulfobacter sp.]
MKKSVKILMSVVVFLFIASASQAATFNLDLSEYGGSDDLDVYSLVFTGFPSLTVYDDDTFSESGSIPIYLYTESSAGSILSLGTVGLSLYFEDLTGTIAADDTISFTEGQYVYFKYGTDTVATFELLANSGGDVSNAVTQTYYLNLISSSIIDSDTSDFEALIVASNFSNQYNSETTYFMSGEVFAAVPVPQSLLLISSGLCCLVGLRRKA